MLGKILHSLNLHVWPGILHSPLRLNWRHTNTSGQRNVTGVMCFWFRSRQIIHVNPWLIYVNVWQKPLQYCKVISLQLIKINGKKRKIQKEKKANQLLPSYFSSTFLHWRPNILLCIKVRHCLFEFFITGYCYCVCVCLATEKLKFISAL